MGEWTTELKSGKHAQANAVLYDGNGYCCLGLREHLEGIKFKYTGFDFEDDYGCTMMPHPKVVESWGLGDYLEVEKAEEVFQYIHDAFPDNQDEYDEFILGYDDANNLDEIKPVSILAGMNDAGYSFKQIAAVIEKFGWEK